MQNWLQAIEPPGVCQSGQERQLVLLPEPGTRAPADSRQQHAEAALSRC